MDDGTVCLGEDVRLMLEAGTGDAIAFERLYRKYFPIVTCYLERLGGSFSSPEDLAQEVFVRIWEHKVQYSPYAAVRTYLFGCAKNVLREKRSAALRERGLAVSDFPDQPADPPQSSMITEDDDVIESMRTLIAGLPCKQRQNFELVYVAGFSVAEAAKMLGSSPQSVYSNLHRAREQLRQSWTASHASKQWSVAHGAHAR